MESLPLYFLLILLLTSFFLIILNYSFSFHSPFDFRVSQRLVIGLFSFILNTSFLEKSWLFPEVQLSPVRRTPRLPPTSRSLSWFISLCEISPLFTILMTSWCFKASIMNVVHHQVDLFTLLLVRKTGIPPNPFGGKFGMSIQF